jgi:SAM-dependent methyltransferase
VARYSMSRSRDWQRGAVVAVAAERGAAKVVAFGLSPASLTLTKSIADAHSVVSTAEGDATALPLLTTPPLTRLSWGWSEGGMMTMAAPEKVLKEASRLLKPGGASSRSASGCPQPNLTRHGLWEATLLALRL